MTTSVILTEQQETALQQIAQQTGKSAQDVIREALNLYVQHYHNAHRHELLQQARGMWRDRTDLPTLESLRQEFEQRGE